MRIFDWLAELRYRDSFLYRIGLIHFILFFLLLIPLLVDSREVLGINTWIKPMKFAISIGIYSWTMGWIMFDLTNSRRTTRILSKTIGITMIIEIFVILYQASRATRSHFNFDTPFDSILFAIMGIMILVNTLAVVVVFFLFLFKKSSLDRIYLIALRTGILLFLVASYVGKVMIDQMAHGVGVEDGGPGIPFLNWSLEGGDLRVAHFMGLHALQLIPFFAFIIKKNTSWSATRRLIALAVFVVVYAGVFALLYSQALKGIPLVSPK